MTSPASSRRPARLDERVVDGELVATKRKLAALVDRAGHAHRLVGRLRQLHADLRRADEHLRGDELPCRVRFPSRGAVSPSTLSEPR